VSSVVDGDDLTLRQLCRVAKEQSVHCAFENLIRYLEYDARNSEHGDDIRTFEGTTEYYLSLSERENVLNNRDHSLFVRLYSQSVKIETMFAGTHHPIREL
jgi:hypothetical protein